MYLILSSSVIIFSLVGFSFLIGVNVQGYSDSKYYSDRDLGLSFNYPSNFVLSKYPPSEKNISNGFMPLLELSSLKGPSIFINYKTIDNNSFTGEILNQLVKTTKEDFLNKNNENQKCKESTSSFKLFTEPCLLIPKYNIIKNEGSIEEKSGSDTMDLDYFVNLVTNYFGKDIFIIRNNIAINIQYYLKTLEVPLTLEDLQLIIDSLNINESQSDFHLNESTITDFKINQDVSITLPIECQINDLSNETSLNIQDYKDVIRIDDKISFDDNEITTVCPHITISKKKLTTSLDPNTFKTRNQTAYDFVREEFDRIRDFNNNWEIKNPDNHYEHVFPYHIVKYHPVKMGKSNIDWQNISYISLLPFAFGSDYSYDDVYYFVSGNYVYKIDYYESNIIKLIDKRDSTFSNIINTVKIQK